MTRRRWSLLVAIAALLAAFSSITAAQERVAVDSAGVLRWTADQREVALFGANYCLPSSSDYRAAGYLGVDRKKLIEQDMAHFARLGWDGLRLALWGDWENCDREGNLIVNDHLDLLDYLVFCARQRGIAMLFTPIHRHSALWPDGKDSDVIQGFSKFYPPSELGRNPAAIAAQQNYLRQILQHVNPYTGVALKDEPSIVFIELINEPDHHADDLPGSIAYINALVEAVRDTGCQKVLFHNLSQDFRILPAIVASKAQGFTFGWYPTALVSRRTLTENYLRWVDGYTPLLGDLPPLPRIVYEFDSADMLAGYMYPAMVRAYREAGAQFAAMFAYDMLATAPYNLGWQTHYLNLVYSPTKAVSAIIAAEAMRRLPRGERYGPYPQNRRFGPFRVSYEENSSELVTTEQFLHANDTTTVPPDPARLRQVIGVGGSPLVDYPGRGSYFLERIDAGRWRLELYPDAVFVQDPFAQRLNHQAVSSRLVHRAWPMRVDLPDLGSAFTVRPLDVGNTHTPPVADGTFAVRPGVYLLSRAGADSATPLPDRLGRVGLAEFVCPGPQSRPLQVVPHLRAEYVVDESATITVEVVDETAPDRVTLHVRSDGETRDFPMHAGRSFDYVAKLPVGFHTAGPIDFSVTVNRSADSLIFPAPHEHAWTASAVPRTTPLVLLEPDRDHRRTFTTRASGRRAGYLEPLPAGGSNPGVLRLHCPPANSSAEHAFALSVKSAIQDRTTTLPSARALRVHARGPGTLALTLVENDGTAWRGKLSIDNDTWQPHDVALAGLQPATALKLPLGYPGEWNRELPPPAGRGGPDDRLILSRVEHLQISALAVSTAVPPSTASSIDLSRVELIFE